ncbi:MAG TPA: DUF4304 domain-containing protein [Gemmatimonadaceae bacterium]|jgi:hypothetical protein
MTSPLDSVANAGLTAQLKLERFRKTGRTWRRRVDPDQAIQIVNLQGSMYATRSEGRAALNVAIYFPAVAEVLGLGALTNRPTEADAQLRCRASTLAPDGRDTWIEFAPEDLKSIAGAGSTFLQLYRNFGAPWLDRLSTLRAARDEFARTGAFWQAAAASIACHDPSAARSLLLDALDHASSTTRPHLENWAVRYNLLESWPGQD